MDLSSSEVFFTCTKCKKKAFKNFRLLNAAMVSNPKCTSDGKPICHECAAVYEGPGKKILFYVNETK